MVLYYALNLCCQGIVFVTLVIKLWVNNFAAQSMVVEVLSCEVTTLSSGLVLHKRIDFYRGRDRRQCYYHVNRVVMYKQKKKKNENEKICTRTTIVVKVCIELVFVTGKDVESQETEVPSDRFFIYTLYPHLHPVFYLNIFLFPMLTVQIETSKSQCTSDMVMCKEHEDSLL